jgi:hypothetical protein
MVTIMLYSGEWAEPFMANVEVVPRQHEVVTVYRDGRGVRYLASSVEHPIDAHDYVDAAEPAAGVGGMIRVHLIRADGESNGQTTTDD